MIGGRDGARYLFICLFICLSICLCSIEEQAGKLNDVNFPLESLCWSAVLS
jgi:hypothetical protein